MPDLTVELDGSELTDSFAVAKFSDSAWEINVRARLSEFRELSAIRELDWNHRRAARVGTCAGSSVFWSCTADMATLMVGKDDETWDLAVQVPVGLVDALVRQVTALA